jgi:hypothetical protein
MSDLRTNLLAGAVQRLPVTSPPSRALNAMEVGITATISEADTRCTSWWGRAVAPMAALVPALILMGCATPYQSGSPVGGDAITQVAPDEFRIASTINSQRTLEYNRDRLLFLVSRLSLAHGFGFFALHGESAYGDPHLSFLVKGFQSRPKGILSFDAASIQRSLNRKYQAQSWPGSAATGIESQAQPEAKPRVRSTPRFGGRPSIYVVEGGGHWIDDVMDDGNLIKLEDGSLWQVSPIDAIDSALWLPVSDITVIEGDDPSYPFKLVNTDENEVVRARPLRQ